MYYDLTTCWGKIKKRHVTHQLIKITVTNAYRNVTKCIHYMKIIYKNQQGRAIKIIFYCYHI